MELQSCVNSMWIGNVLSDMENLCISSFLSYGYRFNLYVYEEVKNLPVGVVILDGNEILHKSKIFYYKNEPGKGSFSAFSNLFRYALLQKHGGIWVDMDVVCVGRFDEFSSIALASQLNSNGTQTPTTCFIKCPKNCDFINYCFNQSLQKNFEELRWGEIGPNLIKEAVYKYSLFDSVLGYKVVCPINFFECQFFFESNNNFKFTHETKMIHLWNEMWRRRDYNKNFNYNKNCLYEKIKSNNFLKIKML